MSHEIEREASIEIKGLKGFAEFEIRVGEVVAKVSTSMVNLTVQAYELGELVVKYSDTPDVQSYVNGHNKNRQDAKLGGAPMKAHCWVAAQIAPLFGLTPKWLGTCARAYLKDRESGFQMGKRLAMASADCSGGGFLPQTGKNPLRLPAPPNIEPCFDAESCAEEATEEPVTDERIEKLISQALARFARQATQIHALASAHKSKLKKYRHTDAVERALDAINAEAEVLGFSWVTVK